MTETNLEFHSSRNHDGSEGQGVGADGGDHDGRDVGVDHGGAGRGGVRGAAGGRGDNHPWGQQMGQGSALGDTRTSLCHPWGQQTGL